MILNALSIQTTSLLITGMIFLTGCSNPEKTGTTGSEIQDLTESRIVHDSAGKSGEAATRSEITCPACGHKKMETMPTEVCLITYTCEKCSEQLKPKKGDCCVFCTHGTHKCPSMQE